MFQHARKTVLVNSGAASAQGDIGKFWKHVVDRSALDSIVQNHLPLLACMKFLCLFKFLLFKSSKSKSLQLF